MYYRRKSLTFKVLEFGQPNREPFILMHGFPANPSSWKPTAERLALSGHHVLVPEQRGYSKYARPKHRRDYKLNELVEDTAALLNAAGADTARIVGHDWGGVVAWAFAYKYPKKTRSLTAISAPHPQALLNSLFKSRQMLLSWYMLFFQLPWLPEHMISRSKKLSQLLTASGLEPNIATMYAHSMKDKERLSGALNWYRALPFTLLEFYKIKQVNVPTLFIYGGQDKFLSRRAALHTEYWTSGKYKYLELPAATHWIPEELPLWLADEIVKL